ncbi:phosphopantetheine-binding protein [Catellatospora chokoriensis]|uniref:Carrier domain-containing protein n=1 Tax=Catellatospora chokoriensis TaxID=310353 RepID=A0A8J3NSA9_9ACTN|nr:phosphopantetheine-binding protein [Catellatospora chokoriensis]GIF90313.1 hypothetical protein Cch02nite_37570 [Catellatospora chokoriensis]
MSGARDAVEGLVASAWRNAVGRVPASVDDDFFALGYTSLDASALMAHLREAVGRKVPLRVVFETPTIAGIARQLRSADDGWRERYAYRLQAGPAGGVPMVLAPGTSGTLGWISALADERLGRPVIGLVSRGSYAEAAPLQTMPEIADHLLAALAAEGVTGPVHLVGSCVGGLASIEMAARAGTYGLRAASVTLLNGSFQPEQLTVAQRLQHRLDDIRRMAGLPQLGEASDAPAQEQIRQLFEQVVGSPRIVEATFDEFAARVMVYVHNWHAAAQYQPHTVAVPLAVVYTAGDEDEVGLQQWRALNPPRFHAQPVDGLAASDVGRPEVIETLAALFSSYDEELSRDV